MKKDIHPTYHKDATVTCACGNTFASGSSAENIQTELCNQCHPFFTGTQRIIDTARRVEKFEARTAQKAEGVRSKKAKKTARRTKRAETVKAEAEATAIES